MKIVVADDEKMARIVLTSMLKELYGDTVEIREAKNGRELLRLVKEFCPEIALIDIKMSEMDGLRAISEINSIAPYTQSIIVSGYSEFSFAQTAVSLNVVAYLLKPVNIENLEKEIYKAKLKIQEYKVLEKVNEDKEEELQEITMAALADIHVYIEKHYQDKSLSVKTASEAFNITPNYLSTLFCKKYGCRFVDYLTQVRVRHAQELLREKNWLTVGQVAERVGYGSTRYFSKIFKRLTGYLPSEYAQKAGGGLSQ